jgi:pyruvate/2-oxoglutarate dehydrogenase complex dihydrolipoamide dehydrogenase (E3) component
LEATADQIQDLHPDVVILATGAAAMVPDMPGTGGRNVLVATDVLEGTIKTGEEVVVVGGGMVGCELAEFLAPQGKKVTVLEAMAKVGRDIPRVVRWVVMQRLAGLGVVLEVSTRVEVLTGEGVRATKDGRSVFYRADSVVLALGFQADDRLLYELRGKVPALHAIGDCTGPQRIREAIESGYRVACSL